ncbi:N-acetyl sugar amidotransferase [Fulvivirgaceae bacterium BMA10]|uniref:N-acetyl sugar amidotransferase n=1 Tax=Splendidivirga corallicola TaxID=3051826 RepID=A0ABT8KXZ4_9BACT|nr:N-acetyl sugar amidotransferase [Fulvivirgaceae bacterium BMA10]
MSEGVKQCVRCVLDTTVEEITFDDKGVCNYCRGFDDYAHKTIWRDSTELEQERGRIIQAIKEMGKKHEYDCILGVSGGVDSTYLAYLCKKYELRPLVVHFDNGWNSELAVQNIENIIQKLDYDLQTYVIDWEIFRDIQYAYLKASVVDIEVPTDQFIFAALYELAYKHGIKNVISGWNVATEGIMPSSWIYGNKFDMFNLKNIHKNFGRLKKVKNYPKIGKFQEHFFWNVFGLRNFQMLNYVPYNKAEAKKTIQEELDWRDYGGKHYESIFTRFYQGYILPKKFNIDKRKAHLSTLICTGEITREEALMELQKPPYPKELQEEDKKYVLKKFDISEEEFQEIMSSKRIDHGHYGKDQDGMFNFFFQIYRYGSYVPIRLMRKVGVLSKPIVMTQ